MSSSVGDPSYGNPFTPYLLQLALVLVQSSRAQYIYLELVVNKYFVCRSLNYFVALAIHRLDALLE